MPSPEKDELQIRVVAAGMNPSDWMATDWSPNEGTVLGFDYAGVVVAVGEDVEGGWKGGERVAGFFQGGEWMRGFIFWGGFWGIVLMMIVMGC